MPPRGFCRGLLWSLLLVLSACGGGGSDGGGPTVTTEIPITATATGGQISPSETVVPGGGSASFELSADPGNVLVSVSGCGGELAGNTYTTGPVTATCTVVALFEPPTFSLSGTISVPLATLVDSDVNDPFASYQANDSFEQAQPIPNPGTVGGYVNRPGSGPEGRSLAAGDVDDFFVVDLLVGQQIVLFQGTPPLLGTPDLDLLLYDQSRELVDASAGTGSAEALIVPASGLYYIRVHAFQGASNYVLTVGQSLDPGSMPVRLSDDFVPGEVVARWREQPASSHTDTLREQVSARAQLRSRGAMHARESLLELRPSSRRAAIVAGIAAAHRSGPQAADSGGISDEMQQRLETLLAIKQLAAEQEVEAAEPNYLQHTTLVPNDNFYNLQWHYPLINLPAAWDLTVGDRNVIVAVIDTGILPGHPDLQGQLIAGYDFVSDPERALDGDGIDPDPTDPGDGGPGGSSFHGTHVAGTVGAASNNQIGVTGTAWDVSLMPVRALGKGGQGTSHDLRQAIRWAAGLANDSGTLPERRADIINLSLGGPGFSPLTQQLIDQVRAQGVMVVAAAGNAASSTAFYPAAYNGVIAVSAVQIDQTLAPYSNFGSYIDVAAPGGGFTDLNGDGYVDGVLSTSGNDSGPNLRYTYAFSQGTSMAAPHVAGVLALMKALNVDLGPADIDQLLAAGELTRQIGAGAWNPQFGYGLIDARKAVEAALSGAGDPGAPLLTVNPRALSFGTALDSLQLVISNATGGSLSITDVNADVPWLAVAPFEVDSDGLGSWLISVDRSQLGPGVYSGTILFSSSANDIEVPVLLQSADGLVTGDLGALYVLLLEPESGDVVDQVFLESAQSGYTFSFTGVEPGEYQIITGTDLNNDLFICDPGEACGSYLTLDAPKILVVDRDRSGLDFSANFGATISGAASAVGRGELPAGGSVPRQRAVP